MKKYALALASSLMTLTISAGTQTGTVGDVRVRATDGLHYFYISGQPSNRASCASGTTYWMIRDEESQAGKTQMSMIIAAKMAGNTVSIIGTGSCTRWGDGEDVRDVLLK